MIILCMSCIYMHDASGMNPQNKHDLDPPILDVDHIIEVFSVVGKYKTTNEKSHPETLKDLVRLCW